MTARIRRSITGDVHCPRQMMAFPRAPHFDVPQSVERCEVAGGSHQLSGGTSNGPPSPSEEAVAGRTAEQGSPWVVAAPVRDPQWRRVRRASGDVRADDGSDQHQFPLSLADRLPEGGKVGLSPPCARHVRMLEIALPEALNSSTRV